VKNNYYLAIFDKEGKPTFASCPSAKPVIIPGYEAFHFFMHRPINANYEYATKGWRISEATTGKVCGNNESDTRRECLEKTIRIFNRIDRDKFP
jgi:hypothetical protein